MSGDEQEPAAPVDAGGKPKGGCVLVVFAILIVAGIAVAIFVPEDQQDAILNGVLRVLRLFVH